MLATEIKRVFMNKSFIMVILIGVIAGCIGLKAYNDNVYFHRLAGNEEAISAFDAWLYALGISPSSLLKLILVILISIPFSDSYIYDKKSGYINFIRTRCSFNKYIYSKIIANGIAGGTAVLLIFFILLIISGFIYPFNIPNTELNYVPYGFFEDIYMNSPFMYVVIILLLGSFFGIVFATLGLSSSIYFYNRFAVTAYPFVFYVILVVLAQIFGIRFLLPIILVTPFSILGISLTEIITGYLIIISITIIQLYSLIKKGKSEIY
ncbi:hypothetical protein [Peribacillus simplex]|uniref:hypothetical protein n=1 Tax=Peribacillus simplex TaxID=1478 RepID=UPI00366AEACF